MDSITVYEEANFTGLQRTFTADVPDLIKECFNDCISSVKVVGQPWILYNNANYKGGFKALEEGEYSEINTFRSWQKVSSLKLITDDLSHPQITVYEHPNEEGKKLVLTQETKLVYGDMNDKISSHRVQSGAWVLYDHKNRDTSLFLARTHDYVANYRGAGFDNKVSNVYPLRAGKCSVTATILWDKAEVESERITQIDQYIYNNYTGLEQEFTATTSKAVEKYVSYNFEFSNETSIKVGTSFALQGLVSIDAEASTTFTVKKGETASSTKSVNTEVSTPVKAPPHTQVTVIFKRKELRKSVPVELKVMRANQPHIETGTFRCEFGTETDIDVLPVPLA
ncbi:hypothetical protein NDU88_000442 [Pleurodeles waltl]|uniref:Beta/gamma crystallin 'Greek key' domain-containing protein n=1 Tax=Pleurodeles waltl TaxID=8319 RepID=A0AAV7P2J1_PLEWA|nr:hypothetical protein NDU88_000442 [Pleurodeles waltl]